MKWWLIYAAGFGICGVLSWLFCHACRFLGTRAGFLDRPLREAHKKHLDPVPVLGGVAMFAAWILTLLGGILLSPLGARIISPEVGIYLPGIQTVLPQLIFLIGGAGALILLGLADDHWSLDAFTKFAGQFIVAGAVACWGVRVTLFISHPLIAWAVTTFWILFMINAVNFFDNMDGLAGGTAMIAAFFFMVVAGIRGQYFVAALAAVTAGAAAGFLVHNHPPASLFMGDAGSHFLGYILAVIGALTGYYTPSESPTPAPILIPLFILGLPIVDLIAVVLMRLYHGKPIYIGDHTHISHRFANMGMGRPMAVMLVYLLMFAMGAGGITLLWIPVSGVILIFMQCAAIFAVVSILQYSSSRTRKENDAA